MNNFLPGIKHRQIYRVASACTVMASLLLVLGCTAGRAEPVCVLVPDAMPKSWRPSGDVQKRLSTAPWSVAEAKDAEYAVTTGLNELNDFFSNQPAHVAALGSDTVESVIDASYAASNMPNLQMAARQAARRNLTQLLAPYLRNTFNKATCKDFSLLLAFTNHARALFDAKDERIAMMAALTNAAYRACGSLNMAMGYDYRLRLAAKNVSIDDVWDMVMWSIMFTDAQLIPGIELTAEARELPPALWRFLQHYPLVGASAYSDGARNETFYNTAYLATHIAYIPTGYGRHMIYIGDAPNLYRFLRENFYAVLEMGELDLTAEFVDLFREYGCTEQNDLQLRDGTRYLLKLFHSAGDRWMAYREPREPANTGDYNIVHKAWTGMAAVRVRVPEPAEHGTYGGVIRAWLGYPR